MSLPPHPRSDRLRRGLEAETRAVHWLEARGFRIVSRNQRSGPNPEGRARAPEVDILAERAGVPWVFEVKSGHRSWAEGLGVLKEKQRRRLYLALASVEAQYGRRGRLALLWLDERGAVEVLENP